MFSECNVEPVFELVWHMKLLLCFLLCVVCGVIWGQDPEPISRADSLKRDRELRVFLKQLHDAALNRDTTKLFPLIDEQVGSEPLWMDGIWTEGKRNFIRYWKLDSPKDSSVLWELIRDISQMEGAYSYGNQMNSYILPVYNPKFKEHAWLVMLDSLPVYSKPDLDSTIVGWLPKGTPVVTDYRYPLPKNWMHYPIHRQDPFGKHEPEGWIQTHGIYEKDWKIHLRYKNGKWVLFGTSGFDYLRPRGH